MLLLVFRCLLFVADYCFCCCPVLFIVCCVLCVVRCVMNKLLIYKIILACLFFILSVCLFFGWLKAKMRSGRQGLQTNHFQFCCLFTKGTKVDDGRPTSVFGISGKTTRGVANTFEKKQFCLDAKNKGS